MPDASEAERLLAGACAEFERGRDVFPQIGNYALAPTGEEYVEIVSGGAVARHEEGKFPGWLYGATPAAAIAAWRTAVDAYAAKHAGTLYWRIRPEIDAETFDRSDRRKLPKDLRNEIGRITLWRVYSRLLISNKRRRLPAQKKAA